MEYFRELLKEGYEARYQMLTQSSKLVENDVERIAQKKKTLNQNILLVHLMMMRAQRD